MELPEFIDVRRPKWAALEALLDRAERGGLGRLPLEDARALSRLYRAASSDLLWVRGRAGSADVSGFLNDLVGRAYALTYPGQRVRLKELGRFIAFGFPELMRREWRVFVASLLVFSGGFAFGWVGMAVDPNAAPYLVPTEHRHLDPTQRAEEESTRPTAGAGKQAAFSSFLFTHNIGVAFLAFALGLTAGVGTAIMLFTNGVLLGALAWTYSSKGLGGWFWAWILPHGVPEITAICIAGAGGFILARGLVAPRGRSRRAALKAEAVVAVRLLMGTLALFVLAGLIEGTISQIHPPQLSIGFKLGFAFVVGTAVYAYLWSALMRSAAGPPPSD